ncbi:MAG: 16S rRNA (cytosine(1402)-N(4))-methyltransferase RsmH [Betaproteobacteria bacterium]|nr:16S rRNA (cytosine(1402)-N(4))-methyltransferase RsmH [Betaproteobacteria bacterium]
MTESLAPSHTSVLLEALIGGVLGKTNGTYVDATFGRGGHSQALLARLEPEGRLVALDRDPEAAAAAAAIQDPRFQFVRRPFSQMSAVLAELAIDSVDGVFADLGVSSPQLDQASRGFSFMRDGPLDMRMDPGQGQPVSDWLKTASVSEIAEVLRRYGDERYAGPIARAIVARQSAAQQGQAPYLARTRDLADLIVQTLSRAGAPRESQHPATRSFQALRIFINHELEELDSLLDQSARIIKPGGRLAIISFHSLEDRRVKQAITQSKRAASFQRPPGMGRAQSAILAQALAAQPRRAVWTAATRIRPLDRERASNPRARSAVLRIATRAQP